MKRPPFYRPPVQPLTTSAQRKLVRGVEQVVEILTEVYEYEKSGAFEFDASIDQVSPTELHVVVFADGKRLVTDDWPTRIGEAIQNLRASLDHATYAKLSEHSYSQFPITTSEQDFRKAAKRDLLGVEESVRWIIEKHQPWKSVPSEPKSAGLELLRVMSNVDKHRELVTVASAVEREALGVPNDTNVRWLECATDKVLGAGRQEISQIAIKNETGIVPSQVEIHLGYRVTIEGHDMTLLKGFVDDVFRAVAELETGEPLSLFAPYPISLA